MLGVKYGKAVIEHFGLTRRRPQVWANLQVPEPPGKEKLVLKNITLKRKSRSLGDAFGD